MGRKQLKELLALTMIGDGLLAATYPKKHLTLWDIGPPTWRRPLGALVSRPLLTRVLGVSAVAAGLALARRQYVH